MVLTLLKELFVFFSNQLGICGLRVQWQLHMEVSQLHYNSRLYTKMASDFVRVTSHENALYTTIYERAFLASIVIEGLMLTGLWVGRLKIWQNTDRYMVKLFTACRSSFYVVKIKLCSVYFCIQSTHTKYMKICTIRKFPAIRYLLSLSISNRQNSRSRRHDE